MISQKPLSFVQPYRSEQYGHNAVYANSYPRVLDDVTQNTLNQISFYAQSVTLFFLDFDKDTGKSNGKFCIDALMHTTIMACAEKEAFHNV